MRCRTSLTLLLVLQLLYHGCAQPALKPVLGGDTKASAVPSNKATFKYDTPNIKGDFNIAAKNKIVSLHNLKGLKDIECSSSEITLTFASTATATLPSGWKAGTILVVSRVFEGCGSVEAFNYDGKHPGATDEFPGAFVLSGAKSLPDAGRKDLTDGSVLVLDVVRRPFLSILTDLTWSFDIDTTATARIDASQVRSLGNVTSDTPLTTSVASAASSASVPLLNQTTKGSKDFVWGINYPARKLITLYNSGGVTAYCKDCWAYYSVRVTVNGGINTTPWYAPWQWKPWAYLYLKGSGWASANLEVNLPYKGTWTFYNNPDWLRVDVPAFSIEIVSLNALLALGISGSVTVTAGPVTASAGGYVRFNSWEAYIPVNGGGGGYGSSAFNRGGGLTWLSTYGPRLTAKAVVTPAVRVSPAVGFSLKLSKWDLATARVGLHNTVSLNIGWFWATYCPLVAEAWFKMTPFINAKIIFVSDLNKEWPAIYNTRFLYHCISITQ